MIKLISTEDKIEITSPKEIVLTAGGSQLKINGSGIFTKTGGKFESKAGQHSFVGGEKVNIQLPFIPKILVGGYSQQFNLKSLGSEHGDLIGSSYKIINKNTQEVLIQGAINSNFETDRVYTEKEEELELIVYETQYTDFNIENFNELLGE